MYAENGRLRWGIVHGPLVVAEDGEKVLDVHLLELNGAEGREVEVQDAGKTLFELHEFLTLTDGTLAILSRDGIYSLENGRWKLRHRFDLPIVKSHGSPFSAFEDNEGTFWIGTHYGGLVVSSKDGETSHFRLPEESRRSNVRALMQDDAGSIWVATDDGLYQLRKRIVRSWTHADGIPEDSINAIIEGDGQRIWVAVDEAISAIDDGVAVSLYHKLPPDYHIHGVIINRLCNRDSESIWVGLQRYSKEEQVWLYELWQTDGETLSFVTAVGGRIQALHACRDGSLLLGTEMGLKRWNGSRLEEAVLPAPVSRLPVTAIVGVNDSRVMIAVEKGGLYQLAETTPACLVEHADARIGSGQIRSLSYDNEGRLWIGCGEAGLALWFENRWRSFDGMNRVLPQKISGVAADDGDGLWIASVTGEGLVRLNRDELMAWLSDPGVTVRTTSFDREDGLPSLIIQATNSPMTRDRSGRIWISTSQGVAAVNPNDWSPPRLSPRAHIQEVFVDDGLVRDFISGISDGFTEPPIVVPPGRRRVEFRFAAVEFASPESVRYRYRLDGYDDRWTEAGQRTSTVYPELPPGEYGFRVAATAGQGLWREEDSTLVISVKPLWWERRSAHILGGIGLTGLLYCSYFIRLRQVKERTRLQEDFARALIRSQETERQRLANDLHDSLGHELLVLKGDLDRAAVHDENDQLRPISEKAGAAIQMVREISHNLRPPELERFGIGPALESMAHATEAATGIHMDAEIQTLDRRLDPDMELGLFRIAQEALSNMAKHSDASEGKLVFRTTDDHIDLIIEDDGRGFDFPSEGRSGLGLVGMKERALLLGGTVECLSRRTKGARVMVSLPPMYRSPS